MTELKAQVNRLEAEVEEQRTHKQVAMVENEHLRMEVESLRSASIAGVGAQIGLKEADSECKEFCPVGLSEFVAILLFLICSESSGGRASLLSAEGETRRADHQSCRFNETGEYFQVERNAKRFLAVNFESVQNADTVKLLSAAQQEQDGLLRAKHQVENKLENLQQEQRNMVRCRQEQETLAVVVRGFWMLSRAPPLR